MQINLENLVSITEANQNFSKVARMVDNKGATVILKNNKPKYVIVDYDDLVASDSKQSVVADQQTVDEVASGILSRHLEAFKELAK